MSDHSWLFELLGAIVAVGLYFGISFAGAGGPAGLIRGEDGRLSTSKFQFFLWTGVVVGTYASLFVAARFNCSATCDAMKDLPQNVLLAMGFSVVTSTAAKSITAGYVSAGKIVKGGAAGWRARDLVTADDGTSPDLSKVQMLTWTLIAAATYVYKVVALIPTFGAQGGQSQFPDIDSALMVLMGLGQGAYLGAKIVTTNQPYITSLTPARGGAPGTTVRIAGSGFGGTVGSVHFDGAPASVAVDDRGRQIWSDGAVAFVVPRGNGGANYKSGDAVDVCVVLQGSNDSAISNAVRYVVG